ncbi:DUF397 domain-containing protein [Streptomyces sp. NPDC005438]|uniref:DUF397 domain-containing protein n=1 Tax=Streptomyces sp. NPDC005438 TaxID=3156880 RepID=UPI0033BE3D5B
MALSANWTKSRYSGERWDACVEARLVPHGVQVRDSKDPSLPPTTSPTAWRAFLEQDLTRGK